ATTAPQAFTVAVQRATTTTLSSPTANPTTFGQPVVLNASVTTADGTPVTGSVDFVDTGGVCGTAALANGSASLTTGAIGVGAPRTVKAVYQATALFQASEASLARTVNALATTTTLTATAAQYSDISTFETTVTGSPALVPAQSARFKVGNTVDGGANFTGEPVAGLYRATFTGQLVEPTYTPTGGALKPGAKIISVVY